MLALVPSPSPLSHCYQVLLSALPEVDGPQGDGYLCREQEGDMKYMVAFREPCRALEWCLLVQVRVTDTERQSTQQRSVTRVCVYCLQQ